MRTSYDHEYPPGEWTVDRIAEALGADESAPFPAIDDPAAWDRIRSDRLTGPLADRILDFASAQRGAPVPRLPASLYLDYDRTGNRRRYQRPNAERVLRLGAFALAECFEREGRYLDDVLDYAWAICEQSTWVLPAHLREAQNRDGLPGVVPEEERTVALRSAETAKYFAEIDWLLGDRLHPALRERVRREVDRRVLRPYEARDHHWMTPPTANWNAVCNAGVAVAALHLCDDRDRAARIVHRAVTTLRHYLGDFDGDGCTAEGISYWNYGLGHYLQLAEHLRAQTGGELSLLSPPILGDIARYPLKIRLSPGRFVPFSDAIETDRPLPYLACRLGERVDVPGLAALGCRALEADSAYENFSDALRTLAWCSGLDIDPTVPTPESEQFLDGYDWWLARADPADPDGVVVAAKGGHNGEAHNHNDCGTFVFHARGESLLTDLGKPVYDADYFSERRYEYLAARSLAHSVPYVNGCEQAAGETHVAETIGRSADGSRATFAVDIAACYPERAGVETLERRFELDRDAGSLTIDDRVRFAREAPGRTYQSVLISLVPMRAADGEIVVDGDRAGARIAPSDPDVGVEIERLADAIDKSSHVDADSDYRDVWRARLSPPPAEETTLRLTVRPETA